MATSISLSASTLLSVEAGDRLGDHSVI
jgi:hypothetical protein